MIHIKVLEEYLENGYKVTVKHDYCTNIPRIEVVKGGRRAEAMILPEFKDNPEKIAMMIDSLVDYLESEG